MAVSGGPDIATDGLVLALDTAGVKSFRGVPTTNLARNPDYANRTYNTPLTAASWGGDAGTITYYPSGGIDNLPFKRLIIFCAIVRPNPVPSYLRVTPSLNCLKASNITSRFFCGIPIPVSIIFITPNLLFSS